jgi:hypothetical protein
MPLFHALSQLTLLGARSIVMPDGRMLEIGDIDPLLADMDETVLFVLEPGRRDVEVLHSATGARICAVCLD